MTDRISLLSARFVGSLSLAILLAVGCGDDAEVVEEAVEEAESAREVDEAPATNDRPTSNAFFPQRERGGVSGGPTKDAACEYLTAARAAAILEVPEDELEEAGRCGFRWNSDTHIGEVKVGRVYVYDNLDDSQTSFRTATGNRLAEGTQAEATEVHEAAAEALEANGVEEGIIAAAAAFQQSYVAVEGIGDEAAFARHDGQLVVRIANMRFAVTAYKCPRMPEEPPPSAEQLRDLEGLAREARAETNRWIADTIDVRRRMAGALAQEVAGALEEFRASL